MTRSQDDVVKDAESWADISDFQKLDNNFYSVEQTNASKDETERLMQQFFCFPDADIFVASVYWARKMCNYSVLSQQKRLRL